jgi:glycosyltransferase involved in cell wall biosynthesis
MDEILQTADVFAFPSYREGLGIAAIEALLCGVPLIVGNNRGTREYARDGYNAMVLQPDDVSGFAHAIETLYTDRTALANMHEHARQSALEFTVDKVEQTMKQVYEEALAEPSCVSQLPMLNGTWN